jgi:hypothetical protein
MSELRDVNSIPRRKWNVVTQEGEVEIITFVIEFSV